jgi:molecular chaperone GrpE
MKEQSRNNGGPAVDSTKAIRASVESLKEELKSATEKFLRLAADFDNYKKRAAQEADRRAAAQKEALIRELLPVIDNLERALSTDSSASPEQLRLGVEMTLQQLQQLLRHHGVEAEKSVGQPFDPHRHEAVRVGHDPSQPDEAVLEVYQPGYYRGGDVFRPATVVVNHLGRSEAASSRT